MNDTGHEQFYCAVQYSPNSIVITDTDGTITYVNPKFQEVTGFSPEEVIGKNPKILKSGEQDSDFYSELWRVIGSGEPWRGVLRNKRKDGSLYWERASIAAMTSETGEIIGYIGIKEDITAEQECQQAIRESEERTKELVRELSLELEKEKLILVQQSKMAELGSMIGSIAHQWKQPLNAITILTEAVLMEIESGEMQGEAMQKMLHGVVDQARFMSQAIEDFRNFYKPSHSRSAFELHRAIVSTTDLLKSELSRNSISLRIEIDEKLLIFGLLSEFRQAVFNIINNAK